MAIYIKLYPASEWKSWLLWDLAILDVHPRLISDQLIHVDVTILQKQLKFSISFIYGLNCYIQRRHLWSSLCALSAGLLSSPWILLGDFNVVRYNTEKLGGNQDWPAYMNELNDCCLSSSLDDLHFAGQLFTWSKGSGSSYLARKLDRSLVNP